jgi:hypothetical protein
MIIFNRRLYHIIVTESWLMVAGGIGLAGGAERIVTEDNKLEYLEHTIA